MTSPASKKVRAPRGYSTIRNSSAALKRGDKQAAAGGWKDIDPNMVGEAVAAYGFQFIRPDASMLAAPAAAGGWKDIDPSSRLAHHGPAALSDAELLSVLLGFGDRAMDAARAILNHVGSMAGLARAHAADLLHIDGIGDVKSRQLTAVVEMARRMFSQQDNVETIFSRPEKVHEHFRSQIMGLSVEKMWVLCLNRKNRLICQVEVTSGTATSALAHPREVFRAAIRAGATCVICVHNHPSGDPAPSAADVMVTRQLRDAAKAVDIDLNDHVIVGVAAADPMGRGFYSFRESGLI